MRIPHTHSSQVFFWQVCGHFSWLHCVEGLKPANCINRRNAKWILQVSNPGNKIQEQDTLAQIILKRNTSLRIQWCTIEKIVDHAASVNLLLVTLYLLPILLTRDLNAAGRCAHNFAIGIYRLLPAVVRAEKTFLQRQFVHIALSAAGAKVNILVRTNDQRTF